MSFNLTFNFTGQPAQGFRSPYVPRGVYFCRTTKVELGETEEKKRQALKLESRVEQAFVYGEDHKFGNNNTALVGNQILTMVLVDAPDEDQARMNENKLKAMLMSHGNFTREQAKTVRGALAITAENFLNRPCYILFDPPQGDVRYPDYRFLEETEAKALIAGQMTLTPNDWPQAKALARAAQEAIRGEKRAGNAAASLLAGASAALPAFGAPASAAPSAPAPSVPSFGAPANGSSAPFGGSFAAFGVK